MRVLLADDSFVDVFVEALPEETPDHPPCISMWRGSDFVPLLARHRFQRRRENSYAAR
jgi:hypothetical protein